MKIYTVQLSDDSPLYVSCRISSITNIGIDELTPSDRETIITYGFIYHIDYVIIIDMDFNKTSSIYDILSSHVLTYIKKDKLKEFLI